MSIPKVQTLPTVEPTPEDGFEVELQRVEASQKCLIETLRTKFPRWLRSCKSRKEASCKNLDRKEAKEKPEETLLYLAYGSNLSAETFRGRRGIRPISWKKVCVPSLRLTFDLPGVPYAEPCFGNSSQRDPDSDGSDASPYEPSANDATTTKNEETPLLKHKPDYRKDRWLKPLVGVVYELTPDDYAHVIATEGGGASYRDVLVTCYPLEPDATTVPWRPTSKPFEAHTLFAPPIDPPKPGDPPPKPGKGGRFQRPKPGYAQPSPRYLKLIADGAEEHGLPAEYRHYLAQIRPFRVTRVKQRVGQIAFLAMWGPVLLFILAVQTLFADDKGRNPPWLIQLMGSIFGAVWSSYDNFFKNKFGEGERTLGDDDDDGGDEKYSSGATAVKEKVVEEV